MKLALAICTALPVFCMGQGNLVPNGGFDEITSCPTAGSQIHLAVPWTNTVAGSPDLFNECGPSSLAVPVNGGGYQEARSGFSYAGFHAYNLNNGREFVQVELLHPLVESVSYRVSFYVNLMDNCKYSVRTLGAYLSDTLVIREEYSINDLNIEPQVFNPSPEPLSDKENWMLVCDTFHSRFGGEQYLIIGNFYMDEDSDTTLLEAGIWHHSYYYIDDVSVIALDTLSSISEAVPLQLSVNPNPAIETVNIEGTERLGHVQLLDMRGRELLTEAASSQRHTLGLSGVPEGVYLLQVTDAEGRRATQRFVRMAGP